MRKIGLILLVLILLVGTQPALATGEFHLAGYEADSTNRDWNNSLFFQRWSALFDLSLSFSQYGEYADWQKEIQAYLNGAALPDALFKAELNVPETLDLYEQGLIINLRPFIEADMPNLNALLKENPEWEKAIMLKDGAIAALPGLTKLQVNNAVWVNAQWLEALKMDMPTDKESFVNVLRAFKEKDPNRNGKKDEIPFAYLGTWDLKFLAHAYGLIANDYNVYVDDGGQVRYLAEAEGFRDFVAWLRDLYTEGLLDKNGFSTVDSARQITDEKATITYGMLMGSSPVNLLPAANSDIYSIMEPLEYEGEQVYRDLLWQVTRGTFAITNACKDPSALLKAIDYLYSNEGAILAQAGIEGEEFKRDENGKWSFITTDEMDSLNNVRAATIADGGLSYYVSDEIALSYGDENAVKSTQEYIRLNALSELPYPLVMLDKQTQQQADELQAKLGRLFEMSMGRFVLSQTELNDENWAAFLQELDVNGLEEFLAIWQTAYDER